jgi:hypothetical protein
MNLKKYKIVFKSSNAIEQSVQFDFDIDDKTELAYLHNMCNRIGSKCKKSVTVSSRDNLKIPRIAFNMEDVLFVTEV